jgi:hypothetical protein|tara:strand:+ start:5400 stop:5843 length:444 start_codon:yes stop_codon:yes gene_type:complete
MKITVNRFISDDDATLSSIAVDGRFVCFGLEDEYRETKVAGETRIPAGAYKVGIRDVGGFHNRYTRKFPDFHKGMLEIKDVPNFKYILIHIGNTDGNTDGCLLVGKGCDTTNELRVNNSTGAYKDIYKQVIDSAVCGELSIVINDCD